MYTYVCLPDEILVTRVEFTVALPENKIVNYDQLYTYNPLAMDNPPNYIRKLQSASLTVKRPINTTKVMRIEIELIRIASVHTEFCISRNSHPIRLQSIHFHRVDFHRWFETGLRANPYKYPRYYFVLNTLRMIGLHSDSLVYTRKA